MEAPANPTGSVQRLLKALDPHANSLIITMFGDAILPRGGNIWLGSLIALAKPFGISERLVRTGVYRLAREGWLHSKAKGRRSYYTITPSGLHKFADADRRIYAADAPSWDGHWRLVQILPRIGQSERQNLRRELKWLGFGQISPTLLAHPAADEGAVETLLDGLGITQGVLAFRAEAAGFVGADTIRDAARDAWELGLLNADYERFLSNFSWLTQNGQAIGHLSDLDCFVLRTLLIHDYRRILLKDPRLPADLLPDGWNGDAARTACAQIYKAIATRADAHLTDLMETYGGVIPDLAPTYDHRFGGLAQI